MSLLKIIAFFLLATIFTCVFLFSNSRIWLPSSSSSINTNNNCPTTTVTTPSRNDSTIIDDYYINRANLEKLLPHVKVHYGKGINETAVPPTRKCPLVKGRRILINYAAGCCKESQRLNCETGVDVGGFDACVQFSGQSLDADFKARNAKTLSVKTGAGLWIWKPYIIYRTLLAIDDDDVLLYSDSGCEFIANMDAGHVCLQARLKQDIVLFAYEALEINFTKRDAFLLVGCPAENASCSMTHQFLGSPILLRKTWRSLQFVAQWLTYVQDYRIVSNEKSQLLLMTAADDNDKNVQHHRNDQSVLSLLAKKWNISPWPDPSQFGENEYGTSLKAKQEFASISKTFMDLTRNKW